MEERPFIISVTGTKGKTTVVRNLSYFFVKKGLTTLLVDTDGFYLNGKQLGTKKDSGKLYGLTTTVCPGRFLYNLKGATNPIAVLEVSIGSSSVSGLGYKRHNIGIFTNVYDDHIAFRIKSRRSLAQHKAEYIFKRIKRDGVAVFNADDKLIVQNLDKVKTDRGVQLLPVGFNFDFYDLNKHFKNYKYAVTYKDFYIGILSKTGFNKVLDVRKFYWTFDGFYQPSILNLMFVVAGIFSFYDFKKLKKQDIEILYDYNLDRAGGRLTLFESKKGFKILLDFAHEFTSLLQVSQLARHLSTNKVIGIVRFAPNRTDRYIRKIARALAHKFDELIVYDKIDGKNCSGYRGLKIIREVGDVSRIFFEAVKKRRKNHIYQILEEEKALEKAVDLAEAGDIILYIHGDDRSKSLEYIKNLI